MLPKKTSDVKNKIEQEMKDKYIQHGGFYLQLINVNSETANEKFVYWDFKRSWTKVPELKCFG